MSVSITRLAELGKGRVSGNGDVTVSGVQHDSRAVVPGDLFVAIAGEKADGASFAAGAVSRGAVAVLAERDLQLSVPTLVVKDARAALGPVSHAVYGDPSASLACVGVTGTNGKTTVTWLIEHVLETLGFRVALTGTVLSRIAGKTQASAHTTPEADDLARFLTAAKDASATHLLMEVSSHGLAMHRVDGMHFAVGAYTNLTQDHLDFHGTFDAYRAAKERLFLALNPGTSVLFVDDPAVADLATRIQGKMLRCSLRKDADAEIRVLAWTMTRNGIEATEWTPAGEVHLVSPLIGAHNLANLLVTLGCVLALGGELAPSVAALATAQGAPGRLTRVPDARGVAILVDYAHTPDALENVLKALRPLTPGRLLVVFGCGGDRDKGKRPLMGRAAAAHADVALVTSDNPRTESPEDIVQDVLPGLEGVPALEPAALPRATRGYAVIVDRALAIRAAIGAAEPGDTVLIAGKGHEDYQIIGTEKRPFDDSQHAREAVMAAGGA